MAIPPPGELDPFADPGKWVFVNEEWLSVIYGTLSYALNDSFWTGSQTERSAVIQSTLKLIAEMGAMLPPETIEEITRLVYEESDNDCDCEDNEMGNCGSNVRYNECDGVLEYRKSDGTWIAIPPIPSDPPVGEVPPGETPEPSGTVACAKANALHDIVETYWEAIIDTAPAAIAGYRIPALWWAELLGSYNQLSIREVETAVILGALDFQADWEEAVAYWNTNKDEILGVYLCEAQDALSKDAKPTASDQKWFRDYQFDTGNASLNLKLNAVVNGVPKDGVVETLMKVYATKPADFSCDCVGSAPSPDVPEGYGRIEAYLTRALSYAEHDPTPDTASGLNPEELIAFEASEGGDGEIISQNSWRSALDFHETNYGLGLIFKTPDDVRITKLHFDVHWEGSTGGGNSVQVGIFRALETGDWSLIFHNNFALPAEYPSLDVEFPGLAAAHYIAIFYHIAGSNDGTKQIRIEDLKFDIADDGGTWTRLNVLPEQIFPL